MAIDTTIRVGKEEQRRINHWCMRLGSQFDGSKKFAAVDVIKLLLDYANKAEPDSLLDGEPPQASPINEVIAPFIKDIARMSDSDEEAVVNWLLDYALNAFDGDPEAIAKEITK